eukprot:TRINITY_DN58979_c0_g1_i1.p1 TRINITY_DN58979_c0_g1~~TRINITY_DN58979_c0_g1_i1.p1  ORF type:complete len:476 (+),score=203.87 TRINITY_DN58979_c0_g1_i1:52-1479(+)
MMSATEAQLRNISVKAEQLEGMMTGKIDEVRGLKRSRDTYEQEVAELRARLQEAEGRLAAVQGDLDQKTANLKLVADEYNKAQLLKKKYQNTLAEHRGCPRVVMRIRDPSHYDGVQHPQGGGANRHDWGAVCVADPCTINVPSKSKSFVFDSVITPDEPQTAHDLFTQVNGHAMVHDLLHGFNMTLFTFGQQGAGKSHALFGPQYHDTSGVAAHGSAPGLVDVFINQLFLAMEQNNVECFTVKASMMELNNDVLYDLFEDPSQATDQPPHFEVLRDDKGRVHVPGVQQISVNVAQQLTQLFHWGLNTRPKRPHVDRLVGKSHIIFSFSVENYNKKGDFRRAKMTFIDLASASGHHTPEAAWLEKSHQALGDVISVLSTAAQTRPAEAASGQLRQNVPYRTNKLTMLMSDALGGNCKTTMLCCVMPSPSLMEELLTALIYAYHLKCIVNTVSPYDIPADLQKLEEQIRSIDFGGRR